MNDALQTALKKLRLSGLAGSLEVRLQEAGGNSLTHVEFLELILQDELAIRADRLVQRRTKAAVFRDLKTLEDFDWQFNVSIKRKQIYDLATCKFIRERRDLLLMGPPGMVTYCYISLNAANIGVSESPSTVRGARRPSRIGLTTL